MEPIVSELLPGDFLLTRRRWDSMSGTLQTVDLSASRSPSCCPVMSTVYSLRCMVCSRVYQAVPWALRAFSQALISPFRAWWRLMAAAHSLSSTTMLCFYTAISRCTSVSLQQPFTASVFPSVSRERNTDVQCLLSLVYTQQCYLHSQLETMFIWATG